MASQTRLNIHEALPALREALSRLDGVEVAILFGSTARGGSPPRDVDVAILAKGETLLRLGEIASRLAEALGVAEDRIDIVDLNAANPLLLWKILSGGVVIKGGEPALQALRERAAHYPDAATELKAWWLPDADPKPNRELVASRVDELRRNVNFLREEITPKSPEELAYRDILALERALHRAVEAMLDVCRHLVAVYSLGLAESYGEYARKLFQSGKMPRALAEKVEGLAGLRNILVHRYLQADVKKLHRAAKELQPIAAEFINWATQAANPQEAARAYDEG